MYNTTCCYFAKSYEYALNQLQQRKNSIFPEPMPSSTRSSALPWYDVGAGYEIEKGSDLVPKILRSPENFWKEEEKRETK